MKNILIIICLVIIYNCALGTCRNAFMARRPSGESDSGPPSPYVARRSAGPLQSFISAKKPFQVQSRRSTGPTLVEPTARFFSGIFRPPPPPPPYEWCEEEFDPHFGEWYEVCYPV